MSHQPDVRIPLKELQEDYSIQGDIYGATISDEELLLLVDWWEEDETNPVNK